ncbi:MAG: hypothetical protein DVS81_16400 [Candidatus Accumulibacter meliphilus]|jgi:hypothetical protein|uniref:Uncharacterized protein n=1 Tax=Candidatus Accumulibacter meliphilus TaxID=2211374 RepID=A0A369XML8_9PROT|nr:MAG: hypothetical protein DVS81_16400 [Candidatus Accumulibacter meliphilus]
MKMKIDEIFPHVVGDRCSLKDQLFQRAKEQGLSAEQANECFASVPSPLIDSGAFLDNLTGLWRYEFGVPFEIEGTYVWGAHMWVPVDYLHRAIITANDRLSEQARSAYYTRLNEPERHAVTLTEMIPGSKLPTGVPAEFEVSGYGAGNSTVDWVVHTNSRRVLLDVKTRSRDFIEQMAREDGGKEMPEPEHDPALLFRSLDKKFRPENPDELLQGIWIATHIQQSVDALNKAFGALDPKKVHFAILGDWESDVHLLVRREADREYLLDLFGATPSTRFTFTP